MSSYDRRTLEALLDGTLPWPQMRAIMSSYKDPDRFEKMIEIYQGRVPWSERILLPYGEGLFIVQKASGERVVKCSCGHEFCDYRNNWKLEALIYVRTSAQAMAEIYPPMMAADPDWMELREFYCPGCQRQIEVEAVPPGYPVLHDFEPDLETFYRDWLGKPLD